MFWKEDPNLWFVQAEAIFLTARIISPTTKYNHVVASLEYSVLQHATDILTSPVTTTSYDDLRTRLLVTFGESADAKLKKLLTEMDLGDLRPSQLLARMRQLAQNKVSDDVLRTLWLQRLPPRMRELLTISHRSDINTVAEIADRLSEEGTPNISAVNTVRDRENTFLMQKLEQLTKEVAELKLQSRNQSMRRHQNFRNRSPSVSRERRPRSYCYYHRRFGKAARNCCKPCTYPENAQSSLPENL